MKNTTEIGNVTEGAVLSALMKSGRVVLVPFGSQSGYDIVFEEKGKFFRVQCKTGRLSSRGAIIFNLYTVVKDAETGKYQNRSYANEIDFFGVYYPGNQKVYLIPNQGIGDTICSLRVEAAKNGQTKGVKWAKDYELSAGIAQG